MTVFDLIMMHRPNASGSAWNDIAWSCATSPHPERISLEGSIHKEIILLFSHILGYYKMFRTVLKSSTLSTPGRLSLSLFLTSLCALLLALLTSSLPAYAQGQPGGNVSDPGVRAVDI